MSNGESDLLAFLAQQLKRKNIDASAAMGRTPGWDSLAQVDLILALEQKYGVMVPPDLFGQLTDVPAILGFLAEARRGATA